MAGIQKMPEFQWINTVLSNVKIGFSGAFHALRFDNYSDRQLGALSYCFNRRFNLVAMTERLLHVACYCTAKAGAPAEAG